MPDFGEVAYRGYVAFWINRDIHRGAHLPMWETLSPEERGAWMAAARDAIYVSSGRKIEESEESHAS